MKSQFHTAKMKKGEPQMYKSLLSIFGVILAYFASSVFAAEYTVGQKDKAFSVTYLKVKVGDTVHFQNEDPFFHNIFSLSDIQSFDLGSYPRGKSRSVTFNHEGKVEVECAIHPEMHMVVEVTK
jgi:plastocyanin